MMYMFRSKEPHLDINKLNSISTSIIIYDNQYIIDYHLVRVSSRLQPTRYLTSLKAFTFGQSMPIQVGLLDLILHLTGRIQVYFERSDLSAPFQI